MDRSNFKRIDVTFSIWVDSDSVDDVCENMDYNFSHPAIKDMEMIDISTNEA